MQLSTLLPPSHRSAAASDLYLTRCFVFNAVSTVVVVELICNWY